MGIEQRLETVADSLEANSAALKELHTAINTLIAAFTNLPVVKPEAAKVEAVKVEPPKPAPTPAAPAAVQVEAVDPEPVVEPPSDVVDYAVVSKAITEAIKKDRQKVVETLSKFGVKKGPDLKAEQYTAFLKALG